MRTSPAPHAHMAGGLALATSLKSSTQVSSSVSRVSWSTMSRERGLTSPALANWTVEIRRSASPGKRRSTTSESSSSPSRTRMGATRNRQSA